MPQTASPPQYLDEQGNPIDAPASLDAQGNPLPPSGPPAWNQPGGDVVLDNARALGRQAVEGGVHFAQAFNPYTIIQSLKDLGSAGVESLSRPRQTLDILKKGDYRGVLSDVGRYVKENPGAAVGDVAGAYVSGKVPGAIGKGLRSIAPKVMDTGLWRTGPQRLEFPGTPQRLVDEGIVPWKGNVRSALDKTEQEVNTAARTFDDQRPSVAGLLPPAQEETLLGRRSSPTYSGETSGGLLLRADPTGMRLRGEVSPRGWVPGEGAPPQMVDPGALADQAHAFATHEGRIPPLGNVPGPEAADVARARQQYLQTNTRPRTVMESVEQKRAFAARSSYPSRPNAPVQTSESMNFNKGIASANREAAIQRVPKLEGLLSREEDLLGADIALKFGEARGTPMTLAGLTRHILTGPGLMGGVAIGADRSGQALQSLSLEQLIRAAQAQRLLSPNTAQ